MGKSINWENTLIRFIKAIILIVAIGVILHTPITVFLSNIFVEQKDLIKSWKEILIFIALVASAVLIFKYKKKIPEKNLIRLIFIYSVLHIVMILFSYQGLLATIAGLMIDLRYVVYFALVLFVISLDKEFKQSFIKFGLIGAGIVTVFAIMQVYILPYNFLEYIGYNKNTIIPYLLVDQNMNYVRINSTLRGPNPLGAYVIIIISLLGTWLVDNHRKLKAKQSFIVSLMMIGALVALWYSYSRSALLAALLAVAFLSINRFNFSRKHISILAALTLIIASMIFILRDNSFVSHVFLHDNTSITQNTLSNEAHLESVKTGWAIVSTNPFGVGVGSTGSASMRTEDSSMVVENQYLFVAHETGWLGLALFIAIISIIFLRLWKLQKNWLCVSVLASGIGLSVIGFFLPVWADDTVAIIWWGLAAIAFSGGIDERIAFDKKTKRTT